MKPLKNDPKANLIRQTVEKEIPCRSRMGVKSVDDLPDDLNIQLLTGRRKPTKNSEGEPEESKSNLIKMLKLGST